MMKSEFIERTGFYPTADEYEKIEEAYYNFDGNKDEFCKAFIENDGILKICKSREKKIECLQDTISELEKTFKTDVKAYEDKIANLEAELEREQEWKPREDTDNVKQADYIKLQNASSTRTLTDEEATDLLYDWFGFAKEKIIILDKVPVYEVNRHNHTRIVYYIDRAPLYNATDWNYIRFDCGCMLYELHDGTLRQYTD